MPPEQDLSEPLLSIEDRTALGGGESDHVVDDDEAEAVHGPVAPANHDRDEPYGGIHNPYKNHNVRLCLALCAVSGVADSVWGSVVLSGFLYALGAAMGQQREDNTLVGLAEMVQGVSMLLCALPVGVWADRTGKARVARAGGALMLATCAVTLGALLAVDRAAAADASAARQSYAAMLVALALWGLVSGISNGPIQALFADSIPRGRRSELLTWLYSCYLISSSIGPVVSICMLSNSSAEDWSIAETFPVFVAGICLEIPAAILMFFFSDRYVVPEESDASPEPTLDVGSAAPNDAPAVSPSTRGDPSLFADLDCRGSLLSKSAVPYVLFLSSLIVALGSGASVKYFPLFFKEIGLSSSVVQGIYFIVPVSISGFSFAGQRLGKRYGRIETSTAFNTLGTLLLYYLTWISQHVNEGDKMKKAWIVFIYLLRTGIMNCCYPLLESVLMDAVPSNQRAKWKSLESISAFGWTGSALIGGILSDAHSYQYTFAMTATVQLLGGLMMWPIRSLVETEEGESTSADQRTTDDQSEVAETGHAVAHMTEPLLATIERDDSETI